jgi:hypothetical protein
MWRMLMMAAVHVLECWRCYWFHVKRHDWIRVRDMLLVKRDATANEASYLSMQAN